MTREPGDLPPRMDVGPPVGRERTYHDACLGGYWPSHICFFKVSSMTAPPITLHVCLNCRSPEDADTCRAGTRLHAALTDRLDGRDDISLSGVDCLSVCKRPVTVAFAATNKWTYVAADAIDPDEVITAAERYAASEDGRVPWRERPTLLKSGLVARIPPQPETRR